MKYYIFYLLSCCTLETVMLLSSLNSVQYNTCQMFYNNKKNITAQTFQTCTKTNILTTNYIAYFPY